MLWASTVVPDAEREQREVKADLLMAGSRLLGVDALGVGAGDLAFGLDFLRDGAKRHGLQYVSANLADAGGELVFEPFVVVQRGGVDIGITSVLAEKTTVAGVSVLPHKPALTEAVQELRKRGVDAVVLLSNMGLQTDEQLAADVPGIDLIFGGATRRHQEDPVIVGTTAIFQAGSRGKYVGQVTVELKDGGAGWYDPEGREKALRLQRTLKGQVDRYEKQLADADERARERIERALGFARQRLEDVVIPDAGSAATMHRLVPTKIPMDQGLPEQPAMKELVDAALEKLGDAAPGAAGHGATASKRPVKSYGDWMGAQACKECHPTQLDDWRKTPHARAYQTLIKEKRQFDTDCWSCHVTGANEPNGPSTPHDVGFLRNVQCEACHGPARAHLLAPDKVKPPSLLGEADCMRCHTQEQTEGRFVHSEYLLQVDHRP